MASKYLNLEAAATQLSITQGELNRLREAGKIRAFADRGTWKFKAEDVEALSRTLGQDAQFDIPGMNDDMISFDEDLDLTGGSRIVLEEEVGDQPTVISKKAPYSPPSSDSDVRLVVDPALESESWADVVSPPKTLPDSGLRMKGGDAPSQTPLRADSDDDSKLSLKESQQDDWSSISDSDVRLATVEDAGSDITLAAESGILSSGKSNKTSPDKTGASDSDVTLIGGIGDAGSDITLASDEDSAARLFEDDFESDSVLGELSAGPGSGLIYSGDSGIALDLAIDSGISLGGDDDDDSITLAADSGISLVPDSGIGLTLDDSYELEEIGESTIPMMSSLGADDDDADTSFDMPLLSGDSSDEVSNSGVGDSTSVVMFDDDDAADTMEFDSAEVSDDEFVDFDDDDGDNFGELSDDELDSDMLDDDVLEAEDEAFEDDFESGESVSALAVPGGARGAAGAAAVAAEWDMVSFSLVVFSTALMGICSLLMYDLVRSIWGHQTPIEVNGIILDALQGLIKS